MQVILVEDIAGKGKAGDIIKVSDGYARNYLLPRGIVIPATDANIKTIEHRKEKMAADRAQSLEEARAAAEKIEGISVTITSKAGEGGRLFGSVTSQDIANAVNEQNGLFIDKRKIALVAPIKTAGEHSVGVKIYPEVTATLKVIVEA
ncbi:MAG: 50S ribosomal protein L9 [Clostridiales Family XIII bacterium]|jgi:large subunit ribosomal protein L9|nr:50S ribosomal protein L9 [Clostridiales Family XIII bacterium]